MSNAVAVTPAWPRAIVGPVVGLVVTVALHALLYMVAGGLLPMGHGDRQAAGLTLIQLKLLPPAPDTVSPEPEAPAPARILPALPVPSITAPEVVVAVAPDTPRQPATMAAPPAPTAEQWAFAGRYTLKRTARPTAIPGASRSAA